MASQTENITFPLSESSHEGAHIIARQDRIPGWSFGGLAVIFTGAIIGSIGPLGTFLTARRLSSGCVRPRSGWNITRLMALSWRFLLILVPERARRLLDRGPQLCWLGL